MNRMFVVKSFVTALLAIALLSSCEVGEGSSVALYALCRDEGAGQEEVFSASNLIVGREFTSSEVCVSTGDSRVHYVPGFLRIYPYSSDRPTEVELRCKDPRGASKFFDQHSGELVALISDNKVVGVFSAVPPRIDGDCGLILAPNLEASLALCDSFASAWAIAKSECENICRTDDNPEEGMCFVPTR